MEGLEVRTINVKSQKFQYKQNLREVICFLRHNHKIRVTSGKTVNIEIYDDGKCIFLGSKQELFEKLK